MAAIFTKIIFFLSLTLSERKNLSKTFQRASKCVCAINVFGSHRHSAWFGCVRSNSILSVCLLSFKFLRIRACNAVSVVLASIGFPQSNSIAPCAFICAWINLFVFLRNDTLFLCIGFVYLLKNEKKLLSWGARSLSLHKMVNWGTCAKTFGTFRRKTKTAASRPGGTPLLSSDDFT